MKKEILVDVDSLRYHLELLTDSYEDLLFAVSHGFRELNRIKSNISFEAENEENKDEESKDNE